MFRERRWRGAAMILSYWVYRTRRLGWLTASPTVVWFLHGSCIKMCLKHDGDILCMLIPCAFVMLLGNKLPYYLRLYIPNTSIIHKMCVSNQNKASLTVNWLSRVASLHIVGPGRSVMLPYVVVHGQMSLHLRQANTPEEKTIKRALQYVHWLTTLKTVCPIFIHAYISSPYWRLRRKSHSDAVEITARKLASLSSVRLRSVVMARNRKTTHLLWRHDNTADAPFAFLATSDLKMATSLLLVELPPYTLL